MMNNNMGMMSMMKMMNMMNNNMNMMMPMMNNMNNNINVNNNQQPQDLIKRGNVSETYDLYPGQGNKINVVMAASSGLRIVMPTPADVTIKQHIRNYLRKLNLGDGVLKGGLIFLINAQTMDVNSNNPMSSVCKGNASVITVVDVQNVIAASNSL